MALGIFQAGDYIARAYHFRTRARAAAAAAAAAAETVILLPLSSAVEYRWPQCCFSSKPCAGDGEVCYDLLDVKKVCVGVPTPL